MIHPKASRRGWTAEAPQAIGSAAVTEAERRSGAGGPCRGYNTKSGYYTLDAQANFDRQKDGSWCWTLPASEGTKSFADVELDNGQECLRVAFPGQAPQQLPWPAGTTAAQMDACSARFSKRRGELVISVPAPQDENQNAASQEDEDDDEAIVAAAMNAMAAIAGNDGGLNKPEAIAEGNKAEERKAELLAKVDKPSWNNDDWTEPTLNEARELQQLKKDDSKVGCGRLAMSEGGGRILDDAMKQARARINQGVAEDSVTMREDEWKAAATALPEKPKPGEPPEQVDGAAMQMAGTWMLHSAASTNNSTRLQQLLKAGIDANFPDESGVCALEKACVAGHAEIVRLLLDEGAKPNGIPDSPSTPLHRAIAVGARGIRLVQLLVSRGADPNTTDEAGRTPADLVREMGLEPVPELNC